MAVKHILTELENGVLTITFSRPEKKNAITVEMYQDMTDALTRSEEDEGIKVAVITGSHGNFTSGNDLQTTLSWPRIGYPNYRRSDSRKTRYGQEMRLDRHR